MRITISRMTALDQRLLAQLLPLVLSRRCDARIPRSGARGEQVNCYVVYAPREGQPEVLLDRLDGERIEARSWDGTSFANPTTIALQDLDPTTISVTHFWGLAELNFRGVRDFAFGHWTKVPYVRIAFKRMGARFAQRIFNRRTITSRKRLELLRELVESALDGQGTVTPLNLMARRFGHRWAGHPHWRDHQRELEVQLSMLADTGELRATPGGVYVVTGHAMRALEYEEEADRRHRTNVWLQIALTFLTAATVFTGLIQADILKLPTLLDLRQPSKANTIETSPSKLITPQEREPEIR